MDISSPLEGALLYAGHGVRVFPTISDEDGKRQGDKFRKTPLIRAWDEHATTDEAQIRAWANEFPDCNWGGLPASIGTCVFDLDRKKGKDGLATFKALLKQHGIGVPDTLVVETPSGGFHIVLRGDVRNSGSKIADGVDVRGEGGYVLLPGSRIDGKPYKIKRSHDLDSIPDAPAKLIELASAQRHERQEAPADFVEDLAVNVRRFTAYLERQNAPSPGSRDVECFKHVCMGRDFGLSAQSNAELTRDHWMSRDLTASDDPDQFTEDDLAAKIESAYGGNAQNAQGAYAHPDPNVVFAAAIEAAAAEEPKAARKEPIGPISFGEVLTREVAPVREIVPGLVEKGTVTFLSAPGGSHKSRLAVQWGLSIDAGRPIFGRAVERARFVYVSYEDHADEVARRAQTIARRLQLPNNSAGQFWDLSGRDAPLAVVEESGECETRPFWDALREHLTGDRGHKFVVIDSTYNALRFAGSAKINEGAVMAGIGLLQRLCDECDCTLLVLWHPSQSGQERGDASGWSVAWHNAPRARLSITPVKDVEDTYDLKVEKRNHGAKGKPITLHWSDGVLLPHTETATFEQEAVFNRAVVHVAVMSAENGVPIQQQKRLAKWQLDEIERATGRRPTEREIKEALAAALPRGDLRYVRGTQKRTAGYYPPDEEKASALARDAKRKGGLSDA